MIGSTVGEPASLNILFYIMTKKPDQMRKIITNLLDEAPHNGLHDRKKVSVIQRRMKIISFRKMIKRQDGQIKCKCLDD